MSNAQSMYKQCTEMRKECAINTQTMREECAKTAQRKCKECAYNTQRYSKTKLKNAHEHSQQSQKYKENAQQCGKCETHADIAKH